MGVLMNEDLPEPQSQRKGLRHCCCGCSLQTGCVIIGSFGLINGISTLYVALYGLCHIGSRSIDVVEEDHLVTNIIMLLYGALHMLTGLSLIYGADKRRPSFLKFWLYTRYVELVIIVVASFYFLIVMMTSGAPAFPVLASIASITFGISVLAYCIAIVQSFNREITEFDNILPLKEEI